MRCRRPSATRSASLFAASATCVLFIRADTRPLIEPGRSRIAQIREGLGYVWQNKLVLGVITLDLFAVLLGGATGLLPVFAHDVLGVGPEGFGVLRAAPAVGSDGGRWVAGPATDPLAGRGEDAPDRRTVRTDDGGVRLFPLAAAVGSVPGSAGRGGHGVGVHPAKSGADRHPGRMRGRVSAVSKLFIGASNELGEFESGAVARWLGPVGAVAFGGYGSMAVTALWAWLFPSLRKADELG